MKTSNKRKYIGIGLIILFIYLLTIMFLDHYNIDDFIFHAKRISALAEEIKMHGLSEFPYRIYTVQLEGFGYGSPLFYGDLFLYIPAMMVAAGIDVVILTKAILFLCFPLSAMSAYYLAKKLSFNSEMSIFFAVIYMISPYLACAALLRQALGEAYAMVLLPIIASSIYSIMNKRNGNRVFNILLLSISMWCLINIHSITTVLAVFFLLSYVLFMWFYKKNLQYFKETFIDCLIAALIFIILSASFWMPMIEQMLSLNLRGTSGSDIGIVQENTISLYELLFSVRSTGHILNTLSNLGIIEGHYSMDKIGGGVFLVLMYILMVFIYRKFVKKENYEPIILFVFILSSTILLFSTVPFLMDFLVKIFPEIQFPFRLMSFATLLSSIMALYYVGDDAFKVRNNVLILSFLSSILLIFPMLIEQATDKNPQDIIIEPNTVMQMGMLDYLQEESVGFNGEVFVVYTNTYENDFSRNNGITTVKLNREIKEGEKINFPLYYYKGYVAEFDNGFEIECQSNGIGHALITIPKDMYVENINVYYKGTTLQKISYYISCIGWGAILLYAAWFIHEKDK